MRIASAMTSLALSIAMVPWPSRADEWEIASPDGHVKAIVRQAAGPVGAIEYTIFRDGSAVLEPSPLGIVRQDASFVDHLVLEEAGKPTPHDESYTLIHGKRREVHDRYNERRLAFRNRTGEKLEIQLRAFDDGVAFRYRFPGDGPERKTVSEERTGFRVPGASRVWAMPFDDPNEYRPAYEAFWENDLAAGTSSPTRAGWAFPLLFRTPGGRWGLLTEAALDGTYCGSRLASDAPGGLYTLRFPEPGEGNGTGAVQPSSVLPWATPWRVVIVGTSPASIVESMIVESLNPPSAMADTSWIKPGRVSWSWLFDPKSPQDFERLKPFVDLAAEMGWEYTLVDANWDIMKNGTVHDLIAYAKSKGVGVLFWYNSGGPHNVVTERPRGLMDQRKVRRYEFQRLAKWGVKGVKIDFFQSDKQNVIALYHEILRDAADFKIMVNLHGCTLPRGWSRTYPHLMSMEAVRGAENYQFERLFPARAPQHNATLPFTRNAVGPMDYTPVLFRNNVHPLVTTAAHEIALPVIFESGLLHFGGGPEEYRQLAEVPREFLKKVPVAWEETRFLGGEPGSLVVLARLSGESWYAAGIDGSGRPRVLDVDLKRLGQGPWAATVIEDGENRPELRSRIVDLGAGNPLRVSLRANGGFAAVLRPAR
jgi:alpha-glucosidase